MNKKIYKKSCTPFKRYLSFDDVSIKPCFSNISLNEIDLSTSIAENFNLKIPIIASPMDTVCGSEMAIAIGKIGGLGIIHRNQSIKSQKEEVRKTKKEGVLVGAAIGLSSDIKERIKEIVTGGVDIICLDYSVGHSRRAIEATKYIKKKYPCEVMSGNITTLEAIKDYYKNNITIYRYGISNSPVCLSRQISGVGVPLFSAIIETKKISFTKDIKIIADSGIRTSGDIVKALAAGANSVMLGSMLAGAKESLCDTIEINGKLYKKYRGMGSISSMKKGSKDRYNQNNDKLLQPEGREKLIKHNGNLGDILDGILYGVKSGMFKVGAKNIKELRERAEFIEV